MAWQDYIDTIQKIYIAYYQRPADPIGLVYWAQRLDLAGGDLTKIIEAFANSDESKALYGDINEDTIGDVIDAIYQAAFNRSPDEEGKQFYINGFKEGKFTAATIMLNILDGAQNEDLIILQNKIESANNFTKAIDPELDGKNLLATYEGNEDAEKGREFLKDVGATIDTVKTTQDAQVFIKENIADEGDTILTESIVSGEVYTLTDEIDDISGSSNDDLIKAVRDESGSDTTWTAADSVDGGGGTDTMEVTVISNDDGNDYSPFSAVTASNIEKLVVRPIYGDSGGTADDNVVLSLSNFSGLQEVYVKNASFLASTPGTDDIVKIIDVPSLETLIGVIGGDKSNLQIEVDYKTGIDTGSADEVKISFEDAAVNQLQVDDNIEKAQVSLSGNSIVSTLKFNNSKLETLTLTGDGSLEAQVQGFISSSTKTKTIDASGASGNITLTITPSDSKWSVTGGSGEDTLIISQNIAKTFTSTFTTSGVEKVLVKNTGTGTITVDVTNFDGVESVGIKGVLNTGVGGTVDLKNVTDGSTILIQGDGQVSTAAGVYQDQDVDTNLQIEIKDATTTAPANSLIIRIDNMGNDLGTDTGGEKVINAGSITVNNLKALTINAYDADVKFTGNIVGNKLETITLKAEEDLVFNNGNGVLGDNAASTLTSIDASEVQGAVKFTLEDDLEKDFTYTGAQEADEIKLGDQTVGTGSRTLTINTGSGKDILTFNQSSNSKVNFSIDLGADNDTFKVDASTANVSMVAPSSGENVINFGDDDDTLEFTGTNTGDLRSVTLQNLEKIKVGTGGILIVDGDSINSLIQNGKVNAILLGGDLYIHLESGDTLDLSTSNWSADKAVGSNIVAYITGDYSDTSDNDIKNVDNILVNLSSAATVDLDNQSESVTATGSTGSDTIKTGSGNDTIKGGTGADVITTGTGNDNVILDSPFNAADKITDFTSGTDVLKIDLTTEGTLALGAGKFGGDNAIDSAYTSTGVMLKVLKFSKSDIGGRLVKSVTTFLGPLPGSASSSLTNKLWLKGKLISFGTKTIKLVTTGGTINISKLSASAGAFTKTGVLFFYDTDDHLLKMYGVKVVNNIAGVADSTIDTVSKLTSKTIAKFTANHDPAATDIVIF